MLACWDVARPNDLAGLQVGLARRKLLQLCPLRAVKPRTFARNVNPKRMRLQESSHDVDTREHLGLQGSPDCRKASAFLVNKALTAKLRTGEFVFDKWTGSQVKIPQSKAEYKYVARTLGLRVRARLLWLTSRRRLADGSHRRAMMFLPRSQGMEAPPGRMARTITLRPSQFVVQALA